MKIIDLNMDLGEGMENDAQVMPFISSCNVACGGHYGDYDSIKNTLILAQQHHVSAGAHPSFNDHENFGRKYVRWDESRFRESVLHQISLFQKVAGELGISMSHIKMHGALYHATANRPDFVRWTVALMAENFKEFTLYVPAGSLLEKEMETSGLKYTTEAFADRRYNNDGTLVSRELEHAVIKDVPKLVNQLSLMVHHKEVVTTEEKRIQIDAQTYCVHGDNLEIVNHFQALIAGLISNGITVG